MDKSQNENKPPKDMSLGNISTLDYNSAPKKQTVTIRGCGAATKGTKASDKMG